MSAAPERPLAEAEDHRQGALFGPSVMERVAVRRRRVFTFVGLDGRVHTQAQIERVPVVTPAKSVDRGELYRWRAPQIPDTFDALPYVDDAATRAFVATHPEGASLEEIAEHMGYTKQGVADVEARAIRKIQALAEREPWVREWIASVIQRGSTTDGT